jgi:hypothetical protein
MDEEHFKILVNSFKNKFSYVNAWIIYTDVILIGSDVPLLIDYQRLQDLTSIPSTKKLLSAININSIPGLLSYFYLDTDGIKKFIKDTKILNTDNNPIIEYSAPKYLLRYQTTGSFYEMFAFSLSSEIPVVRISDLKQLEKDRILKRAEYLKVWGVPDRVINAMLKAYD